MSKPQKRMYVLSLYVNDFSILLQTVILPLIAVLFIKSFQEWKPGALISSIWVQLFTVLSITYIVSYAMMRYIHKKTIIKQFLSKIKQRRYRRSLLAGLSFILTCFNLISFVVISLISYRFFQNPLALYINNQFLFLIHVQLILATLLILHKLNTQKKQEYMPFVKLFSQVR